MAPGRPPRAFSELRVDYVGFHCFGEQSALGEGGSDEVYFIVQVDPLDPPRHRDPQVDDSSWVTMLPALSQFYENVDSGGTYPDGVTVFRGRPSPLRVRVIGMEHDDGDPNALRAEIQVAVAAVSAIVAVAVPATSAVLLNPVVQTAIVNAVNRLADTTDDLVGRGVWELPTRQAVLDVLDGGLRSEPNIELRWHGWMYLTDGDASYKPYFALTAVVL
jgi:hypothetical protein